MTQNYTFTMSQTGQSEYTCRLGEHTGAGATPGGALLSLGQRIAGLTASVQAAIWANPQAAGQAKGGGD